MASARAGRWLRQAAERGDLEEVLRRARGGAPLEAADRQGRTALRLAAEKGHLQVVRALLARGARVDAPDRKGRTALTAVWCPRVAAALLAAGADVNSRDLRGRSPLRWALRELRLGTARALLEAGAAVGEGEGDLLEMLDFEAAARERAFQGALEAVASRLGKAPQPLPGVPGTWLFAVFSEGRRSAADNLAQESRALEILAEVRRDQLDAGYFSFLMHTVCPPYYLALMPTRDPYAAVAALGTGGADRPDTVELIAWLRGLEREHPFELTHLGLRLLKARFRAPVDRPEALARRLDRLRPVGARQVRLAELRRQVLFLAWE